MSALKRLKVDDQSSPASWRNPVFSDWKLTWHSSKAPSDAMSWDVHRSVIAAGARPALFFLGAAREGVYERQSTELSGLLPDVCKAYLEKTLDFIYGETLGDLKREDVMPLVKIADVLQCPKLQNTLIDAIDSNGFLRPGNIEVLLKNACELQLFQFAESLVELMTPECLMALDFDVLELDEISLMRAIARRVVQVRAVQWASFVGHGLVTDEGTLAIALPNAPAETNRKGYWCHALSCSQPLTKKQTWRIRVDKTPPEEESWGMAFGITSGRRPDLDARRADFTSLLTAEFDTFAFAHFSQGNLVIDYTGIVNRAEVPEGRLRLRSGDIISVALLFPDDESHGDVEWQVNGSTVKTLQQKMAAVRYSLSAEMYRFDIHKQNLMQVTLIDYKRE